MTTAKNLAHLLQHANNVTIVIHQNPDGDAVGSGVALYEALLQLGKKPTLVCTHAVASIFEQIVGPLEVSPLLPNTADLYIVLDCGELHRSGYSSQLRQLAKQEKLIMGFDHHQTTDFHLLTPYYLTDQTAAATAQLVYQFLNELRVRVTPTIATALLLGIYTDTGGFKHANTTSHVLRLASRLVSYGASLSLINQTFYRQLNPARQRLWGRILSELEMSRFGIVVARVTLEYLYEAKATPEDLSGLANMLALITEAKAALVLIETNDGWRGTLRTRHAAIDLGELARLLGGHGQKKAAGFTATKSVLSGKIKKS